MPELPCDFCGTKSLCANKIVYHFSDGIELDTANTVLMIIHRIEKIPNLSKDIVHLKNGASVKTQIKEIILKEYATDGYF